MAIKQLLNEPWTRKHDEPGVPLFSAAAKILYPDSLEDLIKICRNRKQNELLKAAGSHWALSDAAISDGTFIETNDPNKNFPAVEQTLYDVVPECLTDTYLNLLALRHPQNFDPGTNLADIGSYLVHVESGKKIFQLYSELDADTDSTNKRSLSRYLADNFQNSSYAGPWAFPTLGGAGGQTIWGALTTGTHGGDIHHSPIADFVFAIHLVADGGKHYWIERTHHINFKYVSVKITDDEKLVALYGSPKYGGRENFEIIRDDAVFYSVLISAGRFGIVYSVVMNTVRQFCLHEERRLNIWQNIKSPQQ